MAADIPIDEIPIEEPEKPEEILSDYEQYIQDYEMSHPMESNEDGEEFEWQQ